MESNSPSFYEETLRDFIQRLESIVQSNIADRAQLYDEVHTLLSQWKSHSGGSELVKSLLVDLDTVDVGSEKWFSRMRQIKADYLSNDRTNEGYDAAVQRGGTLQGDPEQRPGFDENFPDRGNGDRQASYGTGFNGEMRIEDEKAS